MIKGNIYSIMVGCPSDVKTEANFAIECIQRWNILHSSTTGIALVPLHWRDSSYPSMDAEAQKVLNSQLIADSDALVCVFGARLGTPTSDHISGTVEEIEEHRKANKPVMVFFKRNVNGGDNIEQYNKLIQYKSELQKQGLILEFDDTSEFKSIFPEKLQLFVSKNLESVNRQEPSEQVNYSTDEKDIMLKWCESGNLVCSTVNFIGGSTMYRFGNVRIETKNPREKAELIDFINRLEKDGFISRYKQDKYGNWSYQLALKAFDEFNPQE